MGNLKDHDEKPFIHSPGLSELRDNKENAMFTKTPASVKSSTSLKQSSILSFFKSPATQTSQDDNSRNLSQSSFAIPSSPLNYKAEVGALTSTARGSLMSDPMTSDPVQDDLGSLQAIKTEKECEFLQAEKTLKRKPAYTDHNSDSDGATSGSSVSTKRRLALEKMAKSKRSKVDYGSDDEFKLLTSDAEPSEEVTLDESTLKCIQQSESDLASDWSQNFQKVSTPDSKTAKACTPSTTRSTTSARRMSGKVERRYEWLESVRDDEKREPDDPNYNERTLHIPESAWRQFSAFESQYWEIKSKNFDTIVFFKKGKFYELYEKDADVGHQLFDLKMTDRVNMRMVGVPEATFDLWAGKFVAKGYKVARVDQLESAVGKAIREKSGDGSAKSEKILRRELSYILTRGTLVDSGLLTSEDANYCMALSEVSAGRFGIALVDTSLASFYLCEIVNDAGLMKLETLLVQCRPIEFCLEKNQVSPAVLKLLKNTLPQSSINWFVSGREFWTASQCRSAFKERNYFKDTSPSTVLSHFWENDSIMQALGALLFYLQSLKLDRELVSLKNFSEYDAVQHATSLVLDGQTLVNLDILVNSTDGSEQDTLLQLINHCETPFGKRLLRQWICHPLRHKAAIERRVRMVDCLASCMVDISEETAKLLKGLPDLPRILSRVHAGNASVKDFLKLLNGLDAIFDYYKRHSYFLDDLHPAFKEYLDCDSSKQLASKLKKVQNSFDYSLALHEQTILPLAGFDEPYDEACADLEAVKMRLDKLLAKTRSDLNSGRIAFKDMGKELFQLEIPNTLRFKPPNSSWMITSSTKDVTRYYTPELKRLVQQFAEAEEVKANALATVRKRLYSRLDEEYEQWLALAKVLAEYDCLYSLALVRERLGSFACRPEFVESEKSILKIKGLRHPCMLSNANWIPNDVDLASLTAEKRQMLLLTGPNMGGKSTLLRQTCLAVILAQIGSYVPAESCQLTCVDRIFTRIGASDNILAGQSTFMVELMETNKILKEATPHSLVILDEFGRGTSTFDGYALAFAVLFHLITKCRSLGLFSTHYHMLTDEYADCPLVGLAYMDYLEHPEQKSITFLYKLKEGVAPKSFGMHVARMAGVPSSVIDRAEQVAEEFEQHSRCRLGSLGPSKLFSMRLEAVCKVLFSIGSNQGDLLPHLKALKQSLPRHPIA